MFKKLRRISCFALLAGTSVAAGAQGKPAMGAWITTADRQQLVSKQSSAFEWGPPASELPTITVDPAQPLQNMEGFGFALTGGSAQLLMKMSPASREALLRELFSPNSPESIHVSYLRISIGSSDMNDHAFTYDDLPAGGTDMGLAHFDLGPDRTSVVPVLQQILAINPKITLLGSPWSAPAWMKTNGALKDGSLRPENYQAYARYFVKYLQTMSALGIHLDAITVQNEPRNPHNTPSMVMTAKEQTAFIDDALGPALHAAGLRTKIILYDHNCDMPEYPLETLADAKASAYVSGTGFHLYEGDVSAMSKVHDAYPQKDIYFTEQMVIQPSQESPFKISESVSRIVVGATRNWSRNVLLWNLAADPQNGPHTNDGGCPICQGAVTLDGDHVTRNLAFYTVAQISKFVAPGSVHIASQGPKENELAETAFKTPNGEIVLLVANRTSASYQFAVREGNRSFTATLPALAVGTYIWR